MNEDEKREIEGIVGVEGFDYAFVHYSSFDNIKDEKFHELRKAFVKAREQLSDYIDLDEEL